MKNFRKIERENDGVLVAVLTPEETVKWDELIAAREQVEAALYNARLTARRAFGQVRFYKEYYNALTEQIRPLYRIKFPETK